MSIDIELGTVQGHLEWLKEKLYLDTKSHSAATRFLKRGQVYKCNFGKGIGSEQEKERPCIILQNFNFWRSSNTIVAPITHTSSTLDIVIPVTTLYNPDGSILLDGYALLGNIVTVSKARIGDFIANLSNEDMKNIDTAIALSLDLKKYFLKYEDKIAKKDIYINKIKAERNAVQDAMQELQQKLGATDIDDLKKKIDSLTTQ